MIRIYSNNCKDFTNNGLGILLDFKSSPKITESLNGNFELNFDYAIKGKNVEYLVVDNIIKAPFDGSEQLFRIKKVKPNLSKVSIYATHIFYDLSENFLLDVAPTQKSAVNAINWLLDHAMYKTDFVVTGDISQEETARYVRKNIVDAILGTDNCIVKKWGGEIERDNFQIIYHRRRGTDNGILIKQGKNIKEIELAIDFTNVVTRVIPQGANELLLPEIYVDSPIISTYRNPIVAKYDFNNIKVDENTTEEEAYELLRESAKKLFSDSGIDKPTISVKVNWLELSKTEEYKNYSNLESVRLGDTVTVQALGYEYKIRVIKVVYDCLLNSYIEFEIGDPKADFVNKTINNLTSEMQKNYDSLLQQAKQLATTLINNGFGGHVRIYPDRILIMDTDDESTAKNVWQWNLNGFGHSSTGINGEYGTAITIDGQIVANFITTGTMSVQRIEGLANSLNNINVALELNEKNIQQLITQTAEDLTPTAADTGSFIHLEDSTDSPIIQMNIEGKSKQESRSGKNLLIGSNTITGDVAKDNNLSITEDVDLFGGIKGIKTNRAWSGVYITLQDVANRGAFKVGDKLVASVYVKADQEVTGNLVLVRATGTTNVTDVTLKDVTITTEWKQYSFPFTADSGSLSRRDTRIEFNISTDNNYLHFAGWQLEFGDVASEYEPYGAMPSPEFPSEIKSVGHKSSSGKYDIEVSIVGKNFFNYASAITPLNTIVTQYRLFKINNLKLNTEYTFSGYNLTAPTNAYIYIWDTDDYHTATKVFLADPNSFTAKKSIQINSNANGELFLAISDTSVETWNENIKYFEKLQIEEGPEATEYEPYKSNTILLQLDEPLRGLPNGIKDVAYVRNGILYVDRKVGYHLVTPDDNIFVYGIDQLRYSIGVRGVLDSAEYTDQRQKNLLSNMFIWSSTSEWDKQYKDSFTFRKGSGRGYFYFFFPKSYFTSTTANEILNEFKQKLSTNELDFQYVLSEPYTETIGKVDMPQTYKNISNITTTDELKPNLIVEYVRDTALSNYVEGQLQNERVTREEKMAEFNVAVDAISSRVGETETELNNNYTTTDELEQKLENQKSSVMKETSTLLEQTKSDFKFEILNQINQDGVERLKNTLVTINQEGINVAKSDDDVVSLLNNVGLYVSDGKLRDDNSNLLMKTDRNGAYLKTSETKGTIKENEVIQKEKINHEKYGICQAWYWIGG